jgi:protein SCO1/2
MSLVIHRGKDFHGPLSKPRTTDQPVNRSTDQQLIMPILRFIAAFLLLAPAMGAQTPPARVPSSQLPQALEGVGIDQRLNETLPLDLEFVDEQGSRVTLGGYFGKKPVILALVYYECPMLCTLELNGLLRALRVLPLELGKDFEIVTVSFDPGETPELAAKKKQEYLAQYGRAQGGWHFLTGSQESIEALTRAVGFRYTYDADSDLFNHASAILVLTPEGRLSKYFYGIEYSARDLRLGLVEASAGRVGSPVDEILLYCFHYDPQTGKYGVAIMNVLRAAGVVTVVVLAAFVAMMLRRDRRRRFAAPCEGDSHPARSMP